MNRYCQDIITVEPAQISDWCRCINEYSKLINAPTIDAIHLLITKIWLMTTIASKMNVHYLHSSTKLISLTKRKRQKLCMIKYSRWLTREMNNCSKSSEGGIASKSFRIPSLQRKAPQILFRQLFNWDQIWRVCSVVPELRCILSWGKGPKIFKFCYFYGKKLR